MPSCRCFWIVVSVVLLLASPAGALVSPQSDASKQAKAVAQAALKELKTSLAATEAGFGDAVDAFEISVAGDATARLAAVQALVAAWNTAHKELDDAVTTANTSTVLQLLPILEDAQAQAGAGFGGPYPTGFHPGDGGALDLVEQGCQRLLAKSEARLTARLTKLRGKLEKQLGLGFTVRTRSLNVQLQSHLNAGGGTSTAGFLRTPGPELELMVSVSPLDGSDDAVVGFAGAAPSNASVDVDLVASGLDSVALNVVAAQSGRWSAVANLVTEGNYEVRVTADADQVVALASLGVR